MFLNDTNIEATFMKESFGINGQRECTLVVKISEDPQILKVSKPKDYKLLSEKLSYLDHLAQSGFLDFQRIEIASNDTMH